MRDYFGALAAQAIGMAETVRPLIAPRYARAATVPSEIVGEDVDEIGSRRALAPDRAADTMDVRARKDGPVLELWTAERAALRTSSLPAEGRKPGPIPELETWKRDALRAVSVERASVRGAGVDGNRPEMEPEAGQPLTPVNTVPPLPAADSLELLLPPLRESQAPMSFPAPERRSRSVKEAAEPAEPVVRVRIGRIDVHAVFPAAEPVKAAAPRSPAISLEQYRRARNGNRA